MKALRKTVKPWRSGNSLFAKEVRNERRKVHFCGHSHPGDPLGHRSVKVNLKDYAGNIGQLIKFRNARKVTGIGNFTWGSYNIFDADAALPAWFMTKEGMCYNLDQELNDWLQEARDSVDPGKRKALYSKAQKKIMEEAYWMPFFIVHQIYGRNKNLHIVVGKDEVPRFNEAYWK